MPESLGQALLIANVNYSDKTLSELRGAEVDIKALENVLTDQAIGGYSVQISLDESIHKLRQRIESFFIQASKESLLLFYISGHGIKDRDGKLYFATSDTECDLLMSTGLAATFIHEASERSRCRRQIFILDACFSGAFARGYVHKSDNKIHVQESFRSGTGKIIFTASDDMQYALVGNEIKGNPTASVFTRHIIEGLRTGIPANQSEFITVDRLYQYVHERVLEENPEQRPQLWSFGLSGEIVLARNNQAPRSIFLPEEIFDLLEDTKPKVRLLGIEELIKQFKEPNLYQAINLALEKLKNDDSKSVSARAEEVQIELNEIRKNAENKRQKEADAKRAAEEVARQQALDVQKRQTEARIKLQVNKEHQNGEETKAHLQAKIDVKSLDDVKTERKTKTTIIGYFKRAIKYKRNIILLLVIVVITITLQFKIKENPSPLEPAAVVNGNSLSKKNLEADNQKKALQDEQSKIAQERRQLKMISGKWGLADCNKLMEIKVNYPQITLKNSNGVVSVETITKQEGYQINTVAQIPAKIKGQEYHYEWDENKLAIKVLGSKNSDSLRRCQ